MQLSPMFGHFNIFCNIPTQNAAPDKCPGCPNLEPTQGQLCPAAISLVGTMRAATFTSCLKFSRRDSGVSSRGSVFHLFIGWDVIFLWALKDLP